MFIVQEEVLILTDLVPHAPKGSLLKDDGVGKALVWALEYPDAKPDELKLLLKGSNAT